MKFSSLIRFCLLLISGLTVSGAIQNVHSQQVHTYVDVDSVEVGQIINYSIVVDGEISDVIYPDGTEFEAPVEFISRERYQIAATRDSLVYRLQFFGTENYTIPRLEFNLSDSETTLSTTPVPLYFQTLITNPEEEEFRALKPIFEFARIWWPWILALLLLIAALWYGYRYYKKYQQNRVDAPPAAKPAPFVSPLFTLNNSLKTLPRPSSLHHREEYESFYMTLGDAIRLYLKQVYEFQALEMTTREIIDSLRKNLASQEIITITRKVLNEADMVKFANFTPDNSMALSVYQRAEQFADIAAVINDEQIRYMKYQYEVEKGIIKESEIKQSSEEKRRVSS